MDSVGFRFIHSPKAPLDRNVTHCPTLLRHSCNDARVCQEDATGDWHVAFCKMIRKMVPSGLQLTTSGTKMPKEMLLTASRRGTRTHSTSYQQPKQTTQSELEKLPKLLTANNLKQQPRP